MTESTSFRMPAEWEPHEATWIGWPHNTSDWPGRFGPIPWAYGEIVRRIIGGEQVKILVDSAAHERRARRVLDQVGVPRDPVHFLRIPTDRGWTRDFGPIFVKRDSPASLAIARFRFNGWAKYPDWRRDDRVPERVAKRTGTRLFRIRHRDRDVVLEGGAIDVNGEGTLLTTEECLLDPILQVRNPGLRRSEIEDVLRSTLGITAVIWLARGIVGDDTHGHVDDVCRFVGRRTVVLARETSPGDENHRVLEENRERLEQARLADGSRAEIVRLPMPEPLHFRGRRLPATYANFYISNAVVLVPTFNDPQDRHALGLLGELFSDRPVLGIHAVDLVWGLGTLHCLTQQQPRV